MFESCHIENSFGILVARFRIYKRPINSTPDRVVAFVKATIVLHNFLRAKESSVYCPPQFTDGEDSEGNIINGQWRDSFTQDSGLHSIARVGNRGSWTAETVRETFCDHFLSKEGNLPWQSEYVRRTAYKH